MSRESETGNRESTHVDRLFRAFRERSDSEALAYERQSYSYGELGRRAEAYAEALRRLGVVPGDRVAVFAEASPEAIVALLGHYRCGVVHVPINTRYRAEEAGHILRDSGARAVLYSPGSEQHEILREVRDTPSLEHRIPIDSRFPIPDSRTETPSVPSSSTAVLVYTSGTTGKSKGAALSFRALVDNTLALTEGWRFSGADRLALALPLFHVHGLAIGVHGALLHGMTMLLSARFEASEVVRQFREEAATVFMGVPTMYVRLLEHLSTHPDAAAALSRARLFTSGSAPLPAADLEAFERATGHRILERYGMTETLFTLTNPYDGERRPGTVGRPVAGCEVRVVAEGEDGNGREAAVGEPGEILVKSSGQMTEYWGRPAETRDAYRDGWFVTGDAGVRDAEGYVRILGRQSVDVIKSGGFKISAREIEDVVARHPDVREVAVLGMPDRTWGERIVAAVVLREGADASGFEAAVEDLCRRSLADFKRPREVRLLADLPRNALGKVQKHRIREELASGSPARRPD